MESPEDDKPSETHPPDLEKNLDDKEVESSVEQPSVEEKPAGELPPHMVFPEGGARAWGVALGTAGVLFCTFGYANAFGMYSDINPRVRLTMSRRLSRILPNQPTSTQQSLDNLMAWFHPDILSFWRYTLWRTSV